MIIKGRVCNKGDPDHSWLETYDYPRLNFKSAEDKEKAKELVREAVRKWNRTLRPHEKPRKLLATKVVGPSTDHDWEKSNLVTISKRGGASYDTARCKNCGAKAKRFGIGGTYSIDKKSQRMCSKGK